MPLDAKQCDTPCPGSAWELCGGNDGAISLYSLGGVNGYKGNRKNMGERNIIYRKAWGLVA